MWLLGQQITSFVCQQVGIWGIQWLGDIRRREWQIGSARTVYWQAWKWTRVLLCCTPMCCWNWAKQEQAWVSLWESVILTDTCFSIWVFLSLHTLYWWTKSLSWGWKTQVRHLKSGHCTVELSNTFWKARPRYIFYPPKHIILTNESRELLYLCNMEK